MRRRSMVTAIVVALLGASFVGASPTSAAAASGGSQTGVDFMTVAGQLGPRPSTLLFSFVGLPPNDDATVKVNAKITCEGEHNGDHLHVHWGDLQFKATLMDGADCSGEDDFGQSEGNVVGTCNGLPATASFFFSTEEEEVPSRTAIRLKQGGTAQVDVSGIGCEIHGEPPFHGSIQFHDQTPEPSETEEPPPAP